MRKLFTITLLALYFGIIAQESVVAKKGLVRTGYCVTDRESYDQEVLHFESGEILWKGNVSISVPRNKDMSGN